MPKVVVAKYTTSALFIVPKGIDLEDKTQVKDWETKYATLYIYFVDSTREPLVIEAEFEPQIEYKYPNEEMIEDGYNYGYSDDEEEEEDDEPAPTAKCIVADIIAKVVD